MSIIYPIHKAPYTNFHDLNLDWIIDTLNDFNDRLTKFVSRSLKSLSVSIIQSRLRSWKLV